jgi:hypothetical protein
MAMGVVDTMFVAVSAPKRSAPSVWAPWCSTESPFAPLESAGADTLVAQAFEQEIARIAIVRWSRACGWPC